MSRNVKTAHETQSIRAATKIMSESNIGSVVVVKNSGTNIPVGIITERDIINLLASRTSSPLNIELRKAMSKPIITLDYHASLQDAIQTMAEKSIRRLPIVSNEKMVGIVTDRDIFKAINGNQSLVSSILDQKLLVEYKPMYERLSEFMLSEMIVPDRNQ